MHASGHCEHGARSDFPKAPKWEKNLWKKNSLWQIFEIGFCSFIKFFSLPLIYTPLTPQWLIASYLLSGWLSAGRSYPDDSTCRPQATINQLLSQVKKLSGALIGTLFGLWQDPNFKLQITIFSNIKKKKFDDIFTTVGFLFISLIFCENSSTVIALTPKMMPFALNSKNRVSLILSVTGQQ